MLIFSVYFHLIICPEGPHFSAELHRLRPKIGSTELLYISQKMIFMSCHVMHYIYRSLVYLSVMLRYNEWSFGLVCNSPVQGLVVTIHILKPFLDNN
ncbi:hypothetical protein ACN38_g504 [Penicillium nordicum]|uniref:Uncharacterized protein n=1 Tax=Penicillium nordicum TaxID=229535 RepID=A0A0M8PD82_9EURO|nr:hypothetical protein ACN38_g504 [Penicillium nordicum]